jgi:hypothetical protein
MRRLLVAAALVAAAAAAGATPASAEPACTGGTVGVCYQVGECARICAVHVIVDPYCIHSIPDYCGVVDPLYVDSGKLLGPIG